MTLVPQEDKAKAISAKAVQRVVPLLSSANSTLQQLSCQVLASLAQLFQGRLAIMQSNGIAAVTSVLDSSPDESAACLQVIKLIGPSSNAFVMLPQMKLYCHNLYLMSGHSYTYICLQMVGACTLTCWSSCKYWSAGQVLSTMPPDDHMDAGFERQCRWRSCFARLFSQCDSSPGSNLAACSLRAKLSSSKCSHAVLSRPDQDTEGRQGCSASTPSTSPHCHSQTGCCFQNYTSWSQDNLATCSFAAMTTTLYACMPQPRCVDPDRECLCSAATSLHANDAL